jgi:hypothetical protein
MQSTTPGPLQNAGFQTADPRVDLRGASEDAATHNDQLCATSEMASDGSGGLSGGHSVRSGSHFPGLQRREQPEVVTREEAFAA